MTHRRSFKPITAVIVLGIILFLSGLCGGSTQDTADLAAKLRDLDATVASTKEAAKEFAQLLATDLRARREAVNARESSAWQALKTKADWEAFRDKRIQALRESLGAFPPVPTDLNLRVTKTLTGDGYRIENLVFESRSGLVVTANLYVPAKLTKSMPGILICHSHHNPKTQGELQDMGMTWARQGCLVLVMDQLGHGERRQHPFSDVKKYPHAFKVGRQDYYFRYNVANQLYLVGDTLMGWMAWDMMRGVDLLLSRPGIDRDRIILLGAVAGGGDPAAVTAALDPRIAAVVPFNFGGPQPETIYPLPKDAEKAFNYMGGGSWESTRGLRLNGQGGFLPWVIVGSVAPRGLIYGHEFAWDQGRDPVWQRLEKIYDWYGARDKLAAAAGKGKLSGQPPESTHCNNIGAEHRKPIYPTLKRWFDMPAPQKESQKRHTAEELICLTPEAAAAFKAKPVFELAGDLGAERAAAARLALAKLPANERQRRLRDAWVRLLGKIDPPNARGPDFAVKELGRVSIHSTQLVVERHADKVELVVPVSLFVPPQPQGAKLPVVICVAQEGKQGFLKQRSEIIANLLTAGVAVCLPDVRGTGETRPAGDSRGRQSTSTSLSASHLMLGDTLLGARIRDLRSVIHWLRVSHAKSVDTSRLAVWGDSFAPVNSATADLVVPLDAAKMPAQAEPLGGLLALFGALYEKDIRAVYVRGGLSGYQAALESQFLYLPHDVIVPGALTAGDLCDVTAALAGRPVRLEALVDGLNRRVDGETLKKTYAPALTAYQQAGAAERLILSAAASSSEQVATWLVEQLRGK